MTEEAKERRRILDHERYMRNRELRRLKQRIYYRDNREKCLMSVKRCVAKKIEEAKLKMFRKCTT